MVNESNRAETILTQLKEATRTRHEDVENAVDLTTGTRSIADYRRLLQRFLGFYRACEGKLGEFVGVIPGLDFDSRRKSPMIESDLTATGLPASEVSETPVCAEVPRPESVAQALGMMYVLEGATLGGQYVARHVKTSLTLDADNGCRFFSSYGAEVGPMWKRFGQVLIEQAKTQDDRDEMIRFAMSTFDDFGDWFRSMNSTVEKT